MSYSRAMVVWKNGGSSVLIVTFTPRAVQFGDRMVAEAGIDAQSHVRAGADLKHGAAFGQFIDQRQVLDRAHAMADPVGPQMRQRVAHLLRAVPFAGMRLKPQAGLAGAVKGPGEVLQLAHLFIPRDAEADDPVPGGFGGAEGGFARLVRPEVADAGDDAAQRDAKIALALVRGFADGVQVVAPGRRVAAAAEIGRQEGFGIDTPPLAALSSSTARTSRR